MSRVRPKTKGRVGGGYPAPPGQISWKALFATYRWQAKARKLPFKLTLNEFIQVSSMACFYCGLPPQEHNYYKTQKKNHQKVSAETRARATIYKNGLDRIDNARGYLLTNTIPCCRQCNWAKGTLGIKEFFEWVARLTRRAE